MIRHSTKRRPTIGVLGGGQLGRMLALEAARSGVRVHALDPSPDACAREVVAQFSEASFLDEAAVRAFAHSVDVVTFETERVPIEAAQAANELAPVFPSPEVLHTAQHRGREKRFAQRLGIQVAPFVDVRSEADATHAAQALGVPFLLKTTTDGYDGKAQRKVLTVAAAPSAWRSLGARECIAEAIIDFETELSVLVARSFDGAEVMLGPFRNHHVRGVLDQTIWPTGMAASVEREALDATRAIARALNFTGVLCVEFFVDKNVAVLMNEMAPRPHNSGHLTINAFTSSQFELQARAVLGWPIVQPTPVAGAGAMVNLLGDLWQDGAPDIASAVTHPRAFLHLYGKTEPRRGRKMGHINTIGANVGESLDLALGARLNMFPLADANDEVDHDRVGLLESHRIDGEDRSSDDSQPNLEPVIVKH